MDEEITIIDSNARNERIKNFFINNKKKLILIIETSSFIFKSYFSIRIVIFHHFYNTLIRF